MNPKTKSALEKIRRKLADETAPNRLSKSEYLEVIEGLATDLEGMIDATKQELAEEAGG